MGDWYIECIQLQNKVVEGLKQFLSRPNEKELYTNVIEKMDSYCKNHKVDYSEWKMELKKYNAAEKKKLLIGLGLGIGIGLLCLSRIGDSQKSVKLNEIQILEEQEEYEDVTLEDIDVEMILARKL